MIRTLTKRQFYAIVFAFAVAAMVFFGTLGTVVDAQPFQRDTPNPAANALNNGQGAGGPMANGPMANGPMANGPAGNGGPGSGPDGGGLTGGDPGGAGTPGGQEQQTPPNAEGPVEEGPVEEGPVEEGPVEEGPVEEGPVEEGPVEEGPVEEGPVEEGPAAQPTAQPEDEGGDEGPGNGGPNVPCPAGTVEVLKVEGLGAFSETVTLPDGTTTTISGTVTGDSVSFTTSPPAVIDFIVIKGGQDTQTIAVNATSGTFTFDSKHDISNVKFCVAEGGEEGPVEEGPVEEGPVEEGPVEEGPVEEGPG